jgi:hypothetical protein
LFGGNKLTLKSVISISGYEPATPKNLAQTIMYLDTDYIHYGCSTFSSVLTGKFRSRTSQYPKFFAMHHSPTILCH